MMTQRRVRGTVIAGLLCAGMLCAALAGCGSVSASSAAGASGGQGAAGTSTISGTAAGSSGAPAVGCASADQATMVAIRRSMHLVEPVRAQALNVTQRNQTMVRALFRDFCSAVGHPAKAGTVVHCPADFGMSYTGTFYDGSRSLATFVLGASGCRSLSVAAGGKRQFTMLYGTAAAAAPHLWADMAAVLGVPKYAVSAPPAGVNSGGARQL